MSPDPNAVAVMKAVDALPKTFRRLVHEYGARIVTNIYTTDTRNARTALKQLEIWRERRQNDLLSVSHRGMPLARKNAWE